MNTIEKGNNLKTAEDYYAAMLVKDFDKMASFLNDEVHFISPLAEMQGKEAVVSSAKNLSQILDKIQIRSKFASGDQIMMAYDFLFPTLDVSLRSAVLMEFKNGQIIKIELFFDSKPFEQKA